MAALMDVPFKRELTKALRDAGSQEAPEAVEKRVREEIANQLKARELDMKERLTDAQVKQIMAQAVQAGVQAAFSAMQGGAQVAQMPMIAPIADAIMQGAGYVRPAGGQDPNFPVPPAGMVPAGAAPEVQQNTSPTFPPRAESGMQGIETATPADNLEGAGQ
jgi:hypothetical protein